MQYTLYGGRGGVAHRQLDSRLDSPETLVDHSGQLLFVVCKLCTTYKLVII